PLLVSAAALIAGAAGAQEIDWKKVDAALGKTGAGKVVMGSTFAVVREPMGPHAYLGAGGWVSKLFRSVKPWCYDVTLACWEPDQQTNIGCYHCVGVTVVASHPGWHRGCGVLRNALGAFEMRARSVVKICTTLPNCHTRGNLLIGAFAGPGLCTFES